MNSTTTHDPSVGQLLPPSRRVEWRKVEARSPLMSALTPASLLNCYCSSWNKPHMLGLHML